MKNNNRITARDRNAIKGAIRRAFSRSELRNSIIEASKVVHSDPNRKAVKNWCLCNVCKKPEAKSYMTVDHIVPIISYNSSFEEQGADLTIDKLWCNPLNLQAICPACHNAKTLIEKQQKKTYKDSLKPPKIKKVPKKRLDKKSVK